MNCRIIRNAAAVFAVAVSAASVFAASVSAVCASAASVSAASVDDDYENDDNKRITSLWLCIKIITIIIIITIFISNCTLFK